MSRPVKLPGLSPVATGNPALDNLLRQMIERMDVREGARGDPGEKVVTHKEMKALGLDAAQIGAAGLSSNVVGGSRGGVMVQTPGGSFTRVPYDVFADELRKTALYRDLMQSINSVNRFDGVPAEVRALLLSSLADEASQLGAEIRRLDKKVQSATESLAYTVETVTAAVSGAAAGVREVSFANATANAATAGRITQVTARLDDFSDGTAGTATIEQKMTATANRATGLEAQLTWKVGTNGAMAGIGLASTTSVAGVSTSAVIISAAKFALVGPNEVIADPANPPLNRLPFGYDSVTNTLFINGQVRINAGGPTILDGIKGDPGTNGINGTNGTNGTAGARGSIVAFSPRFGISATAWDAGKAQAVIYNTLYGGALTTEPNTWYLQIGDQVTLSNGSSFAQMRYWGGTSWLQPGVIIDGNLLASGVITAGISLSTPGYIKADGSVSVPNFQVGDTASGVFNQSRQSKYGVVGFSQLNGGAGVAGATDVYGGIAVYAYATNGGTALSASGRSDLDAVDVSGTITSSVSAGVAPINSLYSTAKCTNLNADLLDGLHATDFYRSTNPNGYITAASLSGYATTSHTHNYIGSVTGNVGSGAPSSGGMIFSCLIPGFRFRVDGNFVFLEPTP